jgi:hypothetical protein
MSELKKIYQGDFVKRFDVGGSSGDGGDTSGLSYITPTANYIFNNDPVSPSDIAALTGAGSGTVGVDSTPTGISGQPISTQLLSPDQLGETSSSSGSGSSAAGGAIGALLKALGLGGGNTSTAGLQALTGLLSAAGQYSQNKALTPTFAPPALFGGTSGTAAGSQGSSAPAGTASTGYGPAGGYNYANYKGLVAGAPGLGYAPQTATTPTIPNYYTYGQQPQQSFFTSTPSSATQPTAMKKGGKVSTPQRFAMGGFNTGMMPPVHPSMGLTPAANPMRGGITTGGLAPAANTMVPKMGMAQRPVGMPPQSSAGNQPGRMMGMASGGATSSPPASGPSASASNFTSQVPQNLSGVLGNMRKAGAPSPKPPMANGGALASVSRHVKGPGDGTSDSIPARLANGEYVMDAQTVSMLGNGDNGAGAKILDKTRENIRKHKGAALAKGKMAPDAKPMESYMPKGQK